MWDKRVSDAWERGEREWLLGEGKQSRDERRLRVSDATRGALWGRARGWLLEARAKPSLSQGACGGHGVEVCGTGVWLHDRRANLVQRSAGGDHH